MILLIGAAASGKRSYIRHLGYADSDIADAVLEDKPVLYGLEKLVWMCPDTAMEMLPVLLRKELIACCEVGSGIVPLEREDRAAREATGRLCIALAERAERVIRLVAGIPICIKP